MKLNEHPTRVRLLRSWQYFCDQYEGGPSYCDKSNPLAVSIPLIPGQGGNAGASKYLIQQGLESNRNYATRLNETPCVPLCSQVIDFYASTVGAADSVAIAAPDAMAPLLDNCDLQGQSLLQFMQAARVDAATYGHTFVVVDMLRPDAEIRTQADVERVGLRPYVYGITPDQMINWRFSPSGKLIEAIYVVPKSQAESVLNDTNQKDDKQQYLYWSESEWMSLEADGENLKQIDGGPNSLGMVPVVCLYHKRIAAFEGESLIVNAAHMQVTAINWLSDMLQNLRMTMYAQPVLKSRRALDQVAVGAAALMQLDPEQQEDFAFVTPDSQPFADSWKAWYEFCDMTRATMGLKRATTDTAVESGVSKAWDYHEATKIMTRMALHEQEAVKQILSLAMAWLGQANAEATVQYATNFDLSSGEDDLNSLITMQAAGVPPAAQRELIRRIVNKYLPSLPVEAQAAIKKEIDAWRTVELPRVQ